MLKLGNTVEHVCLVVYTFSCRSMPFSQSVEAHRLRDCMSYGLEWLISQYMPAEVLLSVVICNIHCVGHCFDMILGP